MESIRLSTEMSTMAYGNPAPSINDNSVELEMDSINDQF